MELAYDSVKAEIFMGTIAREKPADLEVLSVFANAVFEECPDYGLTWRELSHCEKLSGFDSTDVYPLYQTLEEAKWLESVPVSGTQHAIDAIDSGEPLHPGVRVIKITENGMKYFGNLVSKELRDNK